jgi:hypothetical protein
MSFTMFLELKWLFKSSFFDFKQKYSNLENWILVKIDFEKLTTDSFSGHQNAKTLKISSKSEHF